MAYTISEVAADIGIAPANAHADTKKIAQHIGCAV